MGVIDRRVEIDAPAERVWEALREFGAIQRWNPAVPESHSTSDEKEGVGATRHCDLASPGVSIEERVIAWKEGESYTVEISSAKKVPLKRAVVTLKVVPNGDKSVFTLHQEYSLKMGLLGRIMDRMSARRQFGSALSGLAAGLKHFVETGNEVTAETNLSILEVAQVPQ